MVAPSGPAPSPNTSTGSNLNTPNWNILNEPIDDDYVLPEFGKLTVALVNQDDELKTKARFVGENNFAEELNAHKGLRKILDNIWKGGIARSYYRQKAINKARHDIEEAESLVLDNNDKERRRYNQSICKTFVSDVEGVIDEDAGDSRESLLANHPELHARISEIVSQYADGTIKDPEEANRMFDDAINDLEDETGNKFGDEHFSVDNIREVAIEARERYNKLMTVTEAVGSKLEHDDALERVMAGFDVLYGNRKTDRLEPKYNAVDKLVDKIQGTKLGCLASPEMVGLAAGAAMSCAEFFGKRMTASAFATVPGISAAIMGGIKAGTTFEQERFRAKFDLRYGREFDEKDKRRKEVMNTLHDHHKASDVMADLKARVHEINDMKNRGENIDEKRNELLAEVAKVKAYLDLEKTGNSVLSYTSELDAPAEQLDLLVYFAQAKEFLTNNGISNIDDRLDEKSNLMTSVVEDIEDNIDDANKRARLTKVKRIAKKAGTGFITGAVTGLVMQEVTALLNPEVQGIFEKDSEVDYGMRLTAGKKLANLISGKKPEVTTTDKIISEFTANGNIHNGEINDSAANISFARNADGTYNLIKDGKEIATGIDWNAETGEMTEQSINMLRAQGITVTQNGSLTETIQNQVTSTRTIRTSFADYCEENVNKVRRAFWYDNNTPGVFDRNELACHYYTDPVTGQHGLCTNMLDSGSFHGDQQAIFSELARDGKIRLLISATQDTQSTPIEVVGELLPNGQLAFVPEEGSFAEQFFDADGKFIGRFAEVVQDLGQTEDGRDLIAPLATAVGQGLMPEDIISTEEIVETVTEQVDIPNYLFNIAEEVTTRTAVDLPTDFPMLFPIVPDGVMNASKLGRFTRSKRPTPDYPGYGTSYNGAPNNYNTYNSYYSTTDIDVNEGGIYSDSSYQIVERTENDYASDRESLSWLGDISENVLERKALNLGDETARYTAEVREKRGDSYADTLEAQVKQSKELSSLDNKVKTIVTIPVHAPTESSNIYKTLSVYAQQENVDMDSFVVLLDLNWRETEPHGKGVNDFLIELTRREIDRAKRDFPWLKVATFEQEGHKGIHEVATVMNDVALTAIDDAIKGGRMSKDNDILIIRNDADIRHMNKNYISSFQKSMKENSKTPMFTGTTWFNIDRTHKTPGFGSVLTIERMNNLFGAVDGRVHTAGGNFAYRASHFAAVNSYGFDDEWTGAGSDDVRVGIRMGSAFRPAFDDRAENTGNPADGDMMDPSTRLFVRVGNGTIDTDDTRYLKFYASDNDMVTNDAYTNKPGGYNQNTIRPADIADFREDIDDPQRMNATIDQFEREMTDFYYYEGGPSERLERIISWWFHAPASDVFELNNVNGEWKFKLTPLGRIRYKQSLRARMGDGYSTDDRNSMQRSITTGEWLTPLESPIKLAA